jgi:hypothetical protein
VFFEEGRCGPDGWHGGHGAEYQRKATTEAKRTVGPLKGPKQGRARTRLNRTTGYADALSAPCEQSRDPGVRSLFFFKMKEQEQSDTVE